MYYTNYKWYLYGLTSYVISINGNCINLLPSFFTRVPVYLNSANQVSFPGNWTNGEQKYNYQ